MKWMHGLAGFAAAAIGSCALIGAALAQAAPDPTKWRMLDPENTLYVETTKGRVIIEMFPEVAPRHIQRIRELTRANLYDGLVFFRVIDGFMAQTGDPENTGRGSAPDKPDLAAEFEFRRGPEMPFVEAARQGGMRAGFYKTLPIITQPDSIMAMTEDNRARAYATHCAGAVAMARSGVINGVDQVNSANSQFYVTRAPYETLDRRYTVWGRVVHGMDAIRGLAVGEPPTRPDAMQRVRLASDLPAGERAPIYVIRTDSADFRKMVDQKRRERGADFSVCDIDFPARIPQDEAQAETERPWWRALIPIIP
jgi:peptidylprolyl isomerase